MSHAGITVTALATTAIKGLRMRRRDELRLDRDGAREDRRFFVADERGRMVNGKQLGELCTVIADYSEAERALTLLFPDGRGVSGAVELGPQTAVGFFSESIRAAPVLGPFGEALSAHAGQPLRLMEPDREGGAVDRGARGTVSLISRASLAALAEVAGVEAVDGRRFRMLIEVDGAPANEEDGWVGRTVRIGQALVSFEGHVGRCLVTSRDPESGEIDLPTLDLLRSYRAGAHATESLPLGVYGRVLEAGHVRVGDAVRTD
jgi:uncharacterized protein YcbX